MEDNRHLENNKNIDNILYKLNKEDDNGNTLRSSCAVKEMKFPDKPFYCPYYSTKLNAVCF